MASRIQLFDRIILGESDASEDFDGARGDAFGHLRGEILAHGGFGDERQSGIAQAGGVVDHQPRGFDFDGHFGEIELHALEFRDRLAELLALLGVGEGVIERALRETGHLRADADAAFVEGLDGDLVAFADFADDVRFGDAAIVEDQLAGGRGADAELVFFLADLKAGEFALDQECRDAFVSGFGIYVGEEEIEAGFVGVGDPEFAAGDAVVVAGVDGAGRQGEGVGAGAGFGKSVARDGVFCRGAGDSGVSDLRSPSAGWRC